MCNQAGIDFGRAMLSREDVQGKSILEVGSLDVNGSLRSIAEEFNPGSYIGVDFQMGPGVDMVCDANNLIEKFGRDQFDLLVSTELLEHVRDWKRVISNFKNVLKPNGKLLVTTRSKGCKFHGYPFDFWRFEVNDMKEIFSDFYIRTIESDPSLPGVFLFAQKPPDFQEVDPPRLELYSVITNRRTKTITEWDIFWFKSIWTAKHLPWKIIKPFKEMVSKPKNDNTNA
jgi:SAM-dependent methyltransferase